jgi:hypothetical protein
MSKQYYRYRTLDGLSLAITEEQHKLITAKFGERAANIANFGWVGDSTGDPVSYLTKVYGDPVHLVLTEAPVGGSRASFKHTISLY